MRRMAVLILLLLPVGIVAQNLVPNWSFEDTLSCPNGTGQIDKANGWSSFKNSPDYFNSCTQGQVGVPINNYGWQYARTGKGYVGIYTYSAAASQAREVIGRQLAQPLTVGVKYFVSFYASRGFNQNPNYHINIGTNKLGVKFSTQQYNNSTPIAINNQAHIFSVNIISDTTDWVKVSGSFIADSMYQFIEIGNFFMDANTLIARYDTLALNAYYYVDDVCVSTDSLECNPTTIIEEFKNFDFIVYPNPIKNFLIIDEQNIETIAIADLTGKIVLSQRKYSNSEINIRGLNKGVYILRIGTKNNFYSKKIIKIN